MSREGTPGSRPSLDISHTSGVPLPDPDEDLDGLADAWEAHYLGTLVQNGDENPDRDSNDNLTEFIAGTDPSDASNFFAISKVTRSGADFVLELPTVAGRIYRLEWSRQPDPRVLANRPHRRGTTRQHRRDWWGYWGHRFQWRASDPPLLPRCRHEVGPATRRLHKLQHNPAQLRPFRPLSNKGPQHTPHVV